MGCIFVKHRLLLFLLLVLLSAGIALAEDARIDSDASQNEEALSVANIDAIELAAIELSSYTVDELIAMQERIEAELFSRGQTVYFGLERGNSGKDVLRLQSRLKQLGYFSGVETGKYNSQTQQAMKKFERAQGLTVDGNASPEDQALLYSDSVLPSATQMPTAINAPKETVDPRFDGYIELNYEDASRYPENWLYKGVVLKGKVVQALGNRTRGFQFRLELTGTDNVVFVFADDPGYNILENDRLTVYATMQMPVTYETVLGNNITIPSATAETVILR